jgi:predicted permease
MLITGAVLANIPFSKLFGSWKSYVIGAIRLLLYPLVTIGILLVVNLCGVQGELFSRVALLCVMVVSMPVGMNTVVYPESVGIDSTEGAKNCFISYVMALVSLPIVFSIAQNLFNASF